MFKWKPDAFLLSLAVAVIAGLLFPGPGAEGGILMPQFTTKAGVALIFFLHGLALSFEKLKAGTLRWPLHLVVQSGTYLLFPLLGLLILGTTTRFFPEDLRLGFFFLCAIPSTVSSSVALTAAARGNVAAAVFNATLSSIIGIFITPLWIALVMEESGMDFALGSVVLDLVLWLLLPLTAGQLLRPWFGNWAARNKALINKVDRGTIVLLVYTSFCDSTQQGVWANASVGILLGTLLLSVALFFAVFWGMAFASKRLGFPPEDRTVAIFCGSKKSLAAGVPMAELIFGGHAVGMILLPLMIYHAMQLVICAWLADRWRKASEHQQG